jgi:DNA-binding Lrp family transcriptional regulator
LTKKNTYSVIVSQADLKHSLLMLRDDGIIEINCADNYEYSVDDIKENLNQIKTFAGNNKVLVLNNLKKFTAVSNEVRDYVATAPHKDFIKAEAFVIHSIAQWLLAKFYLKINKPIVPAKFFKGKSEAEKWLKSF